MNQGRLDVIKALTIMGRNRYILVLMILALADNISRAHAASGKCKMTVQALTRPVHSDHLESMLRLVNEAPIAGSPLHRDSVLAADLEYWIHDFEPGGYTIIAQFALRPEGGTAGNFPNSDSLVLTSPAGRVHFCFPVAYVWNERVERPLNLYFLLTKYLPDKVLGDHWTSVSIANSKHVVYPAPN